MKFGEIVAPSMKELFVQRLEDMILSGELKPGDKLPSERELAAEMKISKTVVHEGIRELTRCGFLDVISRRGVTVADYTTTGNLDTLLAIMKRNGRHMDKHTACSLLDLRCYLECPALEILAASHTAQDIARLEQIQTLAKKVMYNDDDSFAEFLFQYHHTIMRLSGNTITPLIANALVPAVLPFWADYEQLNGTDAALKNLEYFTELIRSGKGTDASKHLRDGIEEYKKKIYLS